MPAASASKDQKDHGPAATVRWREEMRGRKLARLFEGITSRTCSQRWCVRNNNQIPRERFCPWEIKFDGGSGNYGFHPAEAIAGSGSRAWNVCLRGRLRWSPCKDDLSEDENEIDRSRYSYFVSSDIFDISCETLLIMLLKLSKLQILRYFVAFINISISIPFLYQFKRISVFDKTDLKFQFIRTGNQITKKCITRN